MFDFNKDKCFERSVTISLLKCENMNKRPDAPSTPKKKKIQSIFKILIPLLIGFLLLWLIYRNQDPKAVVKALKSDVNYWWIGLSLLIGLASNVFRGLRWQLLIEPIANPKPRTINAVLTTLGTYTVNMALPRAGELWRVAEESRYEKINFAKLLGTLFMDRIMDVVVVGLITVAVVLSSNDFFFQFFARHDFEYPSILTIFTSIWLYVAITIAAVLVWVSYRYLIRFKPVRKVVDMLMKVFEGLRSIWKMKKKWLFLLYTLLLWGGYFLFFYVTFFAFSFTQDLGLGVGLIAFTMGSIAMAVPVQAGMGAWHFMIINTLITFGVSMTDAGVFALVVHTSQSIIWTPLVGFVAIILLPIINKNYTREVANENANKEAEPIVTKDV